MVQNSRPYIRIDLNEFKLYVQLERGDRLTLHFNSPSRRFYLSMIALAVNEMKSMGKIKPILLREHLDLLTLLNESVGDSAGSSAKEHLLHRIYRKWKDALPNLEEAPLFKVLGRKKEEGEGGNGKIYSFTDAEKDGWANLFEYMGSEENVRVKFAIDRIGVGLNETSIVFGDSLNGGAWKKFISSLKTVTPVDRMKSSTPDNPSIAVMPFVNMSEDPTQEYFSDGITEDLITDLSKISGLVVIARNSTFVYKGKFVKIQQAAEDLGVRYILEGSVRRAGEEIRINAQLVDATDGHHLWAERYDGTMGKIFALQDQITQKIVSALAIKLTATEKQQIVEKGTANVEAYDTFLPGWVHYLRGTPEDLAKAVRSFKKAIDLDSNFGRAYAALALAYYIASWYPGGSRGLGVSGSEARLLARRYLKQAMKNPTPLAHHVNALFYLSQRQHQEAVSEDERALSLDPNNPICISGMGSILTYSGKPREALDFINRAMRLDPHNPDRYLHLLGIAQFCLGDLEEAANLFEKAQRINPELTACVTWLACIYGLIGRDHEARVALERFKKEAWQGDEPKLPVIMYFLPFKDRAVADQFAEGLIKAGVKGVPSGYFPAFKENQLTGEEIKKLTYGSKLTGVDFLDGQRWVLEKGENGECTWRGKGTIPMDKGNSRIEGDVECIQYQKLNWGLEFGLTVFRNPRGTYEGKDEYFSCSDLGFSPFSVVR